MTRPDRNPSFVVVGSMKSGTTTLHAWLGAQPGVAMAPKEPNFFSRDEVWERGVDWYDGLFAGGPGIMIRGDVSPSYTNPHWAHHAAARMLDVLPDARIVYVVRHPVERLRSHYLHQLRRGRESRTLLEALADPGNPYVARSSYYACLEPYVQRFPREQLCVVRLEDVVEAPHDGWRRVLGHVGLPAQQPPGTRHYVGAEQPAYTRPLRWLADRGRLDAVRRVPGPARAIGKALLLRRSAGDRQEASARASIPAELLEPVWRDITRLESWLGRGPLWAERGTGSDPL